MQKLPETPFVLACGLVALLGVLAGCEKGSPAVAVRQPEVPQRVWFEDATARLGVRFIHEVETSGRYQFFESIGSGGAIFDFDNDGRLDL